MARANDFVATHLDYEDFWFGGGKSDSGNKFNAANLKLSIGALRILLGRSRASNQKIKNHLLRLIRMAYLMGGDENDVKVGTFVGYNHELGNQEGGF